MPNMVDKERAKFIKDMQDEKAQYERELRADPNDPAAKENLKRVNSALRRYGAMVKDKDTPSDKTLTTLEKQQQMNRKPYNPEEDTKRIPMTKMVDGGMAKGKGGKMYQHNYATGGQVVDHLKKGGK